MAVCKAWQSACYTPTLLRHLHLRGGRYGMEHYSLERLAAMGSWLVRRRPAQHATSITFSIVLPTAGPVLLGNGAQAAHAELQLQLQQQQQQEQAEEGEVNQPMPPVLQHIPLPVQLGAAAAQPLALVGQQQQQQQQQHGVGEDSEDDGSSSDAQDESAAEDPHESDLMTTCLAAVAATATPSLTSMQLSIECITLTMGGWPGGLTSLTRLGFTNHDGGVRAERA